MSIHLIPESERAPGVGHIAPLRLPAARLPYAARASRLQHLAQGHAMAEYLLWAAELASAQQATAEALPLPGAEAAGLAAALQQRTQTPLHSALWPRSAHWLALLDELLNRMAQQPRMQTAAIRQAWARLQQADTARREAWADALLTALRSEAPGEDAALPEAGVAQLLWSALSLYWRQLASQLPAAGRAEPGEQRHLCPVCGHVPTGSLVLAGAQAGVRYLQCSLCECQWHVVRSQCSNCDSTHALDYWCLEDEKAPIKAESCNDCQTYLKAFYQQADHLLELVADDLASLALDAEMEDKELARSGINPLMLPLLT
ncbi:MAG: formate dehydrogenase accessory protein FdhE [Comamonas sp.]|jgi:FdhE protein|uniref:formate dehydrogenase accessory protein FdhE n=1 Tax=Comamonas sp. TaxID=34028 RepID=UPI002841220B|nr:formate dehydrogenase accessory protein FdhE [Comamonas sp.]MDR3065724.1 formate dehydrogenase accessory protein FdhE [Comamonas sp.]